MRNVLFGLVLLVGCGRFASEPPPPAKSEPASPKAEATARQGSLEVALAATMNHAVVQPATDDATYRVDPFVAALVYEAVRADAGAPWFELVPAQGDAPAGYRVVDAPEGSWLQRLGLRKGDVIESINGVGLADRAALPTVLDGAENRVNVSLFREDVSFTHSYRFAEGIAWRDVLVSASGTADEPEVPTEPDVVAVADPPSAPSEPATPSQPSARPPRETPDDPPISEPARPSKPTKLPGGSSRPSSGGSKPPPAPSTPSGGSRPTPSNPEPTEPTPSRPNPADPIQCQGSQCTIAKWYFDDLIASPERLQRDADVVPAIRNDVFSGYKLKNVRPGSAPAKLGFRSEDKITSVNGYDLTDDAQALQLYWSLSATKVFKIRFERNGQSMLKTVVVR